MKLKQEIDSTIQLELIKNNISFPVDLDNNIAIQYSKIDSLAKAAMLYIIPEDEFPEGELPFLVVSAKLIYGVFYHEGKAAMIEVSTLAMNDPQINKENDETT